MRRWALPLLVLIGAARVGSALVLRAAATPDPGSTVKRLALSAPNTPRTAATLTVLKDGRVLLVGGLGAGGTGPLSSTELFDPRTGDWRPAAAPARGRFGHTATLLPDGRVLVVGGLTREGGLAGASAAELYDPAADSWTPAASLRTGRWNHTATLLSDGTVLVVGGETDPPPGATGINAVTDSVERYEPLRDTWAPAGRMRLPRTDHLATLLPDGRVLVSGGKNGTDLEPIVTECLAFDAGRFPPAFEPFCQAVLPVAGAIDRRMLTPITSEIYDPATDRWSETGLRRAGVIVFQTALADGAVLGVSETYAADGSPLMETQVYAPATGLWRTLPANGVRPNSRATFARLANGKVLAAGGRDYQGDGLDDGGRLGGCHRELDAGACFARGD